MVTPKGLLYQMFRYTYHSESGIIDGKDGQVTMRQSNAGLHSLTQKLDENSTSQKSPVTAQVFELLNQKKMNDPSEIPHDEPPVSIKEAARHLSLSEKTIRRMIDDGQLPAFKIRGVWRIRLSDVRKLIQTPPQNLPTQKHNAALRVQAQRGTSLSILLPAGQWPYELACAAWL